MSSVRPTYDSIECRSCLVHLFVYDGDGKRVKKPVPYWIREPMVGRQFSM